MYRPFLHCFDMPHCRHTIHYMLALHWHRLVRQAHSSMCLRFQQDCRLSMFQYTPHCNKLHPHKTRMHIRHWLRKWRHWVRPDKHQIHCNRDRIHCRDRCCWRYFRKRRCSQHLSSMPNTPYKVNCRRFRSNNHRRNSETSIRWSRRTLRHCRIDTLRCPNKTHSRIHCQDPYRT